MNENHKIQGSGELLDEKGYLKESVSANDLVFDYERAKVKLNKSGLKERDYYLLINNEGKYALSFAVENRGFRSIVDCSVFDFVTKEKIQCIETKVMPKGKLELPPTSKKGDISYKSKTCNFNIDRTDESRHIYCKFERSFNHTECEADIYLKQPPIDTMVISPPFKKGKKAFYYNEKITCMSASGYVKVKGRTYAFDALKDFGILDWGRGVLPYEKAWCWGVGCAYVNGKPFGYNIGCGFGDTRATSPNMLFYDGKCHKLSIVDFGIPENFMKEWVMTSDDNRWNMRFKPFFNDHTDVNVGIICEKAERLFGVLNGTAVLDDGTVLNIENMPVFHEKVYCKG